MNNLFCTLIVYLIIITYILYICTFINPYPSAFPYGSATFVTTAKHRLRCGHLNTRRTEHAETWNHSLARYFHIT